MPSLFAPLNLRQIKLANRIVVSPMCQHAAVQGCAQDWHTIHIGQFALGGVGMVMLEATSVEPNGLISPTSLGLFDDASEAAMKHRLDAVRQIAQTTGTVLCLQLGHAGRKGSWIEPWHSGRQLGTHEGGWVPVAPSAIAHRPQDNPPIALSSSALEQLIARFADSAKRAHRAGLDAIELHAAHGYLLHQFLSPIANKRSDDCGGSLENRMRFPLAVLSAMRAVWPDNKPLGVRISATDWDTDSSWDIDEASVFSQACQSAGADWIDVSTGGMSTRQSIPVGPGYQLPFARTIKQRVGIPVMAVGLITEAVQADNVITDGTADMVAMARAFIYNPRWVWHAARELGAQVAAPNAYLRAEPAPARGVLKPA